METINLWNEMCQVIKCHNQAGHSCVDTLNRLWRKDPFAKKLSNLPLLTKDTLEVLEESWTMDRLMTFITPERVTKLAPHSTGGAIVAIRWTTQDFLIDGRRRINHSNRTQSLGPHRILVVRVK